MNTKKIRKDFPSLNEDIIYFDNACMSLRPKQVIEAVKEYYEKYPACHGRSHHKLGKKATEKREEAREKIKKFLGAKKSEEIIFTKNTTEGINMVANSFPFNKGDIVLTSDREHNSNLIPWQNLGNIKHKIIPSKGEEFDMEKFKELLNKRVKLVSLVHTSNLDGYTLPIKEIIKTAHDYGAKILIDGAQSAPHKKIDVRKLDADFFTMSSHKACGPSGIGCLYGKKELLENLKPLTLGGEAVENSTYKTYKLGKIPKKFESGLQDVAGSIGFGKGCDYLRKIGRENILKHEKILNKKIVKEIPEEVEKIGVRNPEDFGGIFSFRIPGIDPHEISLLMDEMSNIAIRSGMHCMHSWFNERNINGSARASLYFYNTKEEVKEFLETLRNIIDLNK